MKAIAQARGAAGFPRTRTVSARPSRRPPRWNGCNPTIPGRRPRLSLMRCRDRRGRRRPHDPGPDDPCPRRAAGPRPGDPRGGRLGVDPLQLRRERDPEVESVRRHRRLEPLGVERLQGQRGGVLSPRALRDHAAAGRRAVQGARRPGVTIAATRPVSRSRKPSAGSLADWIVMPSLRSALTPDRPVEGAGRLQGQRGGVLSPRALRDHAAAGRRAGTRKLSPFGGTGDWNHLA
jgi:hypothetical protein